MAEVASCCVAARVTGRLEAAPHPPHRARGRHERAAGGLQGKGKGGGGQSGGCPGRWSARCRNVFFPRAHPTPGRDLNAAFSSSAAAAVGHRLAALGVSLPRTAVHHPERSGQVGSKSLTFSLWHTLCSTGLGCWELPCPPSPPCYLTFPSETRLLQL